MWEALVILWEIINNVYHAGGAKTRWVIWFWAAFIFLYVLLGKYDTIHKNKIISSRKQEKQNYYYTLHCYGLVVAFVEYGYYLGEWPTKIPVAKTGVVINMFSTAGFGFLILGFAFVVLGRLFLNSYWGKDIYNYEDIKDSYKLVKENVYHLCRHPIYFGQVCMCIGTALVVNNWIVLVASVLMFLINMLRAWREDKYLEGYFKNEWSEYKNATNFFIPLIF